MSEDPARYGANFFAYAGSNPVNMVDGTGRSAGAWMAWFTALGLCLAKAVSTQMWSVIGMTVAWIGALVAEAAAANAATWLLNNGCTGAGEVATVLAAAAGLYTGLVASISGTAGLGAFGTVLSVDAMTIAAMGPTERAKAVGDFYQVYGALLGATIALEYDLLGF